MAGRYDLRRCAAWPLALVPLLLAPPVRLAAQDQLAAQRVEATRDELQTALARFEGAARSRAYSPELRAEAAKEAAAVRSRLNGGDFRPGDRVLIVVEREAQLSDTFVVTPDLTIRLPNVGPIELSGVLRSELEGYLTERIARYVNEPVVHAQSFLRIAITGQVGRPGYHLMPPEMPLSDALMYVGGLSANANTPKMRLTRGDETLLSRDALQAALRQGKTLSELGLRSGDLLDVPQRPVLNIGETARALGLVTGFLFALVRIF